VVSSQIGSLRPQQSFCALRARVIAVLLGAFATAFVVSGCASGNSGMPPPPAPTPAVTPPTNLAYAAKTLMVTVGVAISPDTDTVAGSSATYSVTPALPAGLMLDPSSGVISGTAAVASPATTYLITAMNSAGSATATISISVVIPAPTNLVYSPSAVNDTLGTAMQPDVPTVTGTVSSFTITPALPAGLALDASSGAISGTPAAFSPAASYTVTATNSSGSTTAQITLAVNAGGKVLLEQGHGDPILAIRATATRMLSEDTGGHWVLWDYGSGNQVASGDGAITGNGSSLLGVNQIALAGQLAVVATSSQLQMYSATDGHSVLAVARPSWWKLAADGSYLCAGTATGMTSWDPTGNVVFTLPGDYHAAIAFAAPGQIQLAGGPSGANVIETDTFPGGNISTSAQFSGTFYAWFLDGARFITNLGNTVWVYSASGTQQALEMMPSIQNLTGQGNWLWTTSQVADGMTAADVLSVYAIGSTTPAVNYSFGLIPTITASGTTVGVLEYGSGQLSVVDLSGSSPTRADYTLPQLAYLNAFGAASAAQWFTGTQRGVLVDGASISSQTRYFGYGAVLGIATTPSVTAVSTASGRLLLFNPSTGEQTAAINTFAGKVRLSADGSVLAAAAEAFDAQYVPDRSLTFYSLPSATTSQTIPYTFDTSGTPFLSDFSLSGSGTVVGQVLTSIDGTSGVVPYTRTITNVSSGSLIWMDSGTSLSSQTPILLSPDGTLAAVATAGGGASDLVTNLYRNGSLIGAVQGTGAGWIDNGNLLVANFTDEREGPEYSGYSIVAPDGTVASSVTASSGGFVAVYVQDFPALDRGYVPRNNSIYSLTNGQPIWQGPVPTQSQDQGIGAAAGSTVVYEAGHQVVVTTVP